MTTIHRDLSGQVVVITGASRGIGAATARAFAENGARVVVSGRDEKAISDVVGLIRRDRGCAIGVPADVTRPEELERLRTETERELGPADIVLPFAGGLGAPTPSAALSHERWCEVIAGNLTSTFDTIRVFIPGMIERKYGAIVTMSSAAAREPAPSNVAYAAAKVGVIALTQHLAKELGPHGIRVNCIAPAAVVNERMRGTMTEDAIAALGDTFPLGRVGQPEDVAEAALYLASMSASWVTGVVLDVAGGKVMN